MKCVFVMFNYQFYSKQDNIIDYINIYISWQNLHTSIVMDVGKSLNPALDIGQVFHLSLLKQITPLSIHLKSNLICGCVCRWRVGSCKV